MADTLAGFRVLEVAAWTFVPAAGAVLADWGADVIKVEHPETGDPQRGLVSMGLIPGGEGAVNYIIEQPNRGKRSIGIDISTEGGRDLLYRWPRRPTCSSPASCPPCASACKIDVEHIRAVNPDIVYARGSGQGPLGPDREKGGLRRLPPTGAAAAVANALTPADSEWPDRRAAGLRRPGRGHGHRRGDRRRTPAAGDHRRGTGHRRLPAGPGHVDALARHRGLAASTAATRCPSSTGPRRPTRWWATTGPATTGSSPS